jgi:hypothetical protein
MQKKPSFSKKLGFSTKRIRLDGEEINFMNPELEVLTQKINQLEVEVATV